MYHIMIYNLESNIINISELSNNIIECPICLEIIEDNDNFIIMECCNKNFHTKCLTKWYTCNSKLMVCVMCNQTNSFCNNIILTQPTNLTTHPSILTPPQLNPTYIIYSIIIIIILFILLIISANI